VIADILPATVRSVVSYGDPAHPALFPEEDAVVAAAVERRRREFATTRACAREALAGLDVPPGPIMPGERGAPQWPGGIVGSMTHCAGYRAAAVARDTDVVTLGIDAEVDAPLPDGVLEVIAVPQEVWWLSDLPRDGGAHWDRLLFSAKESIYKAWYPVARRPLGFDEALVLLAPDGTFHARLLVDPSPFAGPDLRGRWSSRAGLVATTVVVAR